MGRGSSVNVVTRLRFGQLMIRGSNSGWINKFVFSQKRPDQFRGQLSLPLSVFGGSFPRVKWPGREVDYSPPSSAEAKNEWRSASSPRI